MLRCPICTTPVHETRYDKAHSGINEHIGWAIHDNHKRPSTHFHLGDLGSSTNEMSELAKAILADQEARGNLVRRPHNEEVAVRNIDDSQQLEQAIVAEEYENNRRAAASRSSASTEGRAATDLGFTFTTGPPVEQRQNYAVLDVAEDGPFNSVRPYTTSCMRPPDRRTGEWHSSLTQDLSATCAETDGRKNSPSWARSTDKIQRYKLESSQ